MNELWQVYDGWTSKEYFLATEEDAKRFVQNALETTPEEEREPDRFHIYEFEILDPKAASRMDWW